MCFLWVQSTKGARRGRGHEGGKAAAAALIATERELDLQQAQGEW